MEVSGLRRTWLGPSTVRRASLAKAPAERRRGNWVVGRKQVIYQTVPNGSGKGSSGSLPKHRIISSLSPHFSQLPGSRATP